MFCFVNTIFDVEKKYKISIFSNDFDQYQDLLPPMYLSPKIPVPEIQVKIGHEVNSAIKYVIFENRLYRFHSNLCELLIKNPNLCSKSQVTNVTFQVQLTKKTKNEKLKTKTIYSDAFMTQAGPFFGILTPRFRHTMMFLILGLSRIIINRSDQVVITVGTPVDKGSQRADKV